jgi:hypothetical protein
VRDEGLILKVEEEEKEEEESTNPDMLIRINMFIYNRVVDR